MTERSDKPRLSLDEAEKEFYKALELTTILGMLHGGLTKPELRSVVVDFARQDNALRGHLLGLRDQLNRVLLDSAWIGAPI